MKNVGAGFIPARCTHDWEDLDVMFVNTADSADSGVKVLQRCRHCWLERVVRKM